MFKQIFLNNIFDRKYQLPHPSKQCVHTAAKPPSFTAHTSAHQHKRKETENKTLQRQKRGKEERTSVLFSIQHTCPISLRLRLFSTQKPQPMHRNLIQQQL